MEEAASSEIVPNAYLGNFSTPLIICILLLYGILFLIAIGDKSQTTGRQITKKFWRK